MTIASCYRDPRLLSVLALILLTGVTAFGADLDVLRERIRARFRGKPGEAAAHLAAQRADGGWPDIDYGRTPRTGDHPGYAHLDRLWRIACAHHAEGHVLHRSADAVDAVRRGWHFWMHSEHKLTAPGGNGWETLFGAPQKMARSFLLMEDHVDDPELKQGVARWIMNSFQNGRYRYAGEATGQNLIWACEMRLYAEASATRSNPDGIRHAIATMGAETAFKAPEGIRVDHSFHQHGPQLYNHWYGAAFQGNLARFVKLTAGTEFAFAEEHVRQLVDLVLDGSRWMVRRTYVGWAANGRALACAGSDQRDYSGIVKTYLAVTDYRAAELKRFLAHCAGKDDAHLVGSKHFYRSDSHFHLREGYHIAVRGSSARSYGNESGNRENMRGRDLAQGGMAIVRDGGEYDGIFPVWNWGHIPGVTHEHRDPNGPPPTWGRFAKRNVFVGGVTAGRYGAMALAMDWKNVRARKAWFFFDDVVVCLGAGISGSFKQGIHTTLNQCHLRGKVVHGAGGTVAEIARGRTPLQQARWVWHDHTGYIFPVNSAAVVECRDRRGSWWDINRGGYWLPDSKTDRKAKLTMPVFCLYVDHGPEPKGADYAYVLAPDATAAETALLAKDLPVTILANTADTQVVHHAGLERTGIILARAGSQRIDDALVVKADKPCILWLDSSGEDIAVTVADPNQREKTLRVALVSAGNEQVLDFDLPQGEYRGRSVTKRIRSGR